jgi:hypothetical protein
LNITPLKYNIMKFVLSIALLGFFVLSCKKKEVTPVTTSDSTVIADSMTTPIPSDTVSAVDSSSVKHIDTTEADTTKKAK